jgi:hypothetical protein
MNIWTVYHFPTASTYYFDFKPKKSDLDKLTEKEGLDGETPEYDINKVKVITKRSEVK